MINRDNTFSSSVYRKPTFSGLFTNFENFIPLSFKRGLINCLLNRYFRICSSYDIFHTEVLKKSFLRNSYPLAFFENCHSKYLPKIFPCSDDNPTETDNRRAICLPFTATGTRSLGFRDINLHIIFRRGRRLSSFFPF